MIRLPSIAMPDFVALYRLIGIAKRLKLIRRPDINKAIG